MTGSPFSIRQIAETVRDIVLGAEPKLREAVKWDNPIYENKGKIAYISATDAYIALGFFNGAALADPKGQDRGYGQEHASCEDTEPGGPGRRRT